MGLVLQRHHQVGTSGLFVRWQTTAISNAAVSCRVPGCVGGSDGLGFGPITEVGFAVDVEEDDALRATDRDEGTPDKRRLESARHDLICIHLLSPGRVVHEHCVNHWEVWIEFAVRAEVTQRVFAEFLL